MARDVIGLAVIAEPPKGMKIDVEYVLSPSNSLLFVINL